MAYSCAIFKVKASNFTFNYVIPSFIFKQAYVTRWYVKCSWNFQQSEDEDLKAAQMRKISLLIKKVSAYIMMSFFSVNERFNSSLIHIYVQARVDKNHEILEIGFGWGTLAIEIVKQTGCKYTGINLSKEQLRYAESKVKEAGLQVFNLLLKNYKNKKDNKLLLNQIYTSLVILESAEKP